MNAKFEFGVERLTNDTHEKKIQRILIWFGNINNAMILIQ